MTSWITSPPPSLSKDKISVNHWTIYRNHRWSDCKIGRRWHQKSSRYSKRIQSKFSIYCQWSRVSNTGPGVRHRIGHPVACPRTQWGVNEDLKARPSFSQVTGPSKTKYPWQLRWLYSGCCNKENIHEWRISKKTKEIWGFISLVQWGLWGSVEPIYVCL